MASGFGGGGGGDDDTATVVDSGDGEKGHFGVGGAFLLNTAIGDGTGVIIVLVLRSVVAGGDTLLFILVYGSDIDERRRESEELEDFL